eukprot:15473436-Alexandrium_andersonii.AAC.1
MGSSCLAGRRNTGRADIAKWAANHLGDRREACCKWRRATRTLLAMQSHQSAVWALDKPQHGSTSSAKQQCMDCWVKAADDKERSGVCLLYTSPSPRD